MGPQYHLRSPIPPGRYVRCVWTRIYGQILTSTKVNYFNLKWVLIYHNIIWFEISMHDAKLFMEKLQPLKNLFHYHSNFILFIQFNNPILANFLNPLSQSHVHHFKYKVQPPVLIFDPLCFHDIGAVTSWRTKLFVLKLLENLYFS